MSRWNRIGKASLDVCELNYGELDLQTWIWLREAIDDVFHYDPIDDVDLFIRDDNEVIRVMSVELQDNHHSDSTVTREVIIRPNKKAKRGKYVG